MTAVYESDARLVLCSAGELALRDALDRLEPAERQALLTLAQWARAKDTPPALDDDLSGRARTAAQRRVAVWVAVLRVLVEAERRAARGRA